MEPALHREIAVTTYNRCWALLEQEVRTPDDDVELMTLAFASRYHWTFVGGPVQTICADWMISRVAAAQGAGSMALAYAQRAHSAAQATGIDDWLVASCAEGLARAFAALGDRQRRDEWYASAETLIQAIADPEDRALIASQLGTVPPATSPA